MKKVALTLLMLSAVWVSAVAQTTPGANEVIDKYIAAIGGKDLLKSINDLRVEMSSEFNGNPIMITRRFKVPNKFSMVVNANGMEVMKMTSDGVKVVRGGMQGSQTLEGKEAQQAMLQGTLFPELHFAELGVKSTVTGTEKIDGKDAYKVTNTSSDGSTSWTDYYDVASGLKVQTVAKQKSPRGGEEIEMTTRLSDYKDFKGLKYPTSLTQGSDQQQRQMSVDKVKFNEGAKDSDFAAQ
ncbi:hypothetical protein ACFSUS_08885 [Spirosoma soli]|uniref:Outer membrane lipoprotein-sorting protein n=1 Tax=Spirosoma soli TaxID=1770529 RepID=A0ABW5M269_9BACT